MNRPHENGSSDSPEELTMAYRELLEQHARELEAHTQLQRAYDEMQIMIRHQQKMFTIVKQLYNEQVQAASTDAVTGLPNHRAVMNRIAGEIERCKEDTMNPVELLQHVIMLHKTTFALIEKYPDGEQGAFVVTDHLNRRWVLKWAPGANNLQWMQGAKTVTDLLRSLDYPAPYYLLIGKIPEGIYSIQRALPGSPMLHLLPAHFPRLFELNEIQVGRAIPGRKDWHQEVINTVLVGGDNYCLHTSLQNHSQSTADLLQTLQNLVIAHQDEPHRTDDLVHGDFQPSNILMHDGQISGIVDWDGSFAGDCTFDIATLLFYSYDVAEVRGRLWEYALERASLKLLSMYFAHLILRQVDWSLRYHYQTTSERYITRGQMLLQEIAHRSHSAR